MSHNTRGDSGFTLIEILVTIIVVGIILSVVLGRQSTYTAGVTITNAADQVGLMITQAQAFSLGVREASQTTGNFDASYGVVFSLIDTGSTLSYIYFIDRDKDGRYDGDWSCVIGSTAECLEKITLPKDHTIDALCVTYSGVREDWCQVRRLGIMFNRPSLGARFAFTTTSGQDPPSLSEMRGVTIRLKGSTGLIKEITVDSQSGLVSIE